MGCHNFDLNQILCLGIPQRGGLVDLAQSIHRRQSAKFPRLFTTQPAKRTQAMKLWQDLLSTDYGLLSLGVIVFMLVMAVWYVIFFMRKMTLPPGEK
jgi:hypothetical protein